jgi:hypothetical protein
MRTIKDAYWWIMHRFHPKHRYNKPLCSLKPGYYDPRTRIKNVIFEEVCEYIKSAEVNWDSDGGHLAAMFAFVRARIWHEGKRQNVQKEIARLYAEAGVELYGNGFTVVNEHAADQAYQLEIDRDKEEIDILKDVVQHIDYMWYP